ncbi:tyrosine-type recombinase/integrase [Variovorax sp. J22P240]|uniref:tyrosine-type recombinase/integrase n=1 Tax=Variovorax sp. J22P240 TaxID=3053514 RepID=UPI0025777EAF|nr:tyrosine-type recombinase/integrase [Variovorax sp. J22P240]MDL9998270.1 tyrosine-type recombinase/integrase [Variovorax sp. J22P240]
MHNLLFAELCDAYLHLFEGKDPARKTQVAYWREYLAGKAAKDVTADDIEDGLIALAQRGKMQNYKGRGAIATGKPLSGASINRYRSSVSAVFTWARRNRKLPRTVQHPCKDVAINPEPPKKFEFLRPEEIDKLVAVARLELWRKLPLFVLLAYTSGLRVANLRELRWGQVDLEGRRISIPTTKNGRPHEVALTQRVVAELKAIGGEAGRAPGVYVFESQNRPGHPHNCTSAFAALARKALPGRDVTIHTLRHSSASALAAAGASTIQLMVHLNHSSPRMSARYSHLDLTSRTQLVDSVFG